VCYVRRDHIVKQRNIVSKIKTGKGNWIDHILRRNCLLKYVIEGEREGPVRRRRKRRLNQLLDDLKETR
jgi:hypothetical protein